MDAVNGGIAIAAIDRNEICESESGAEHGDVEQFFLGEDRHAAPEQRNDDGGIGVGHVITHEDVWLIRVEALSAHDAGAHTRKPDAAARAPHSELPEKLNVAGDQSVR